MQARPINSVVMCAVSTTMHVMCTREFALLSSQSLWRVVWQELGLSEADMAEAETARDAAQAAMRSAREAVERLSHEVAGEWAGRASHLLITPHLTSLGLALRGWVLAQTEGSNVPFPAQQSPVLCMSSSNHGLGPGGTMCTAL